MDEKGVPLGLTLIGANRHDVSQLGAVLDRKIAHQPGTARAVAENRCANAGHVGEKADAIICGHGYTPHVRPHSEEIKAKKNKRFKPRCWIVEMSHSWFNLFRKLKVHYEKTTANSLVLQHLAAATLALRRCRSKTGKNIIYGLALSIWSVALTCTQILSFNEVGKLYKEMRRLSEHDMSSGHENVVSHDDREPPSIRSFGITFAVVLVLIALFPVIWRGEQPRYWALVLGGAFAVAVYLAPGLLKPLNLLWFKLGMLLHKVVNPLVLGIMFVVFITPMALVLRLFGKKLIPLTFERDRASYWIERNPPGPAPDSLRKQF